MNATAIRLGRRSFGVVALAAAACADWPASVPEGPRGVEPGAAIAPGPYVPGQSYTGSSGYIVYYPGNSPMIFAAPHGGPLKPAEIPDRTTAVTSCDTSDIDLAADAYTRQLALSIRQAFIQRTGRYPHVIVSTLHRSKLDPNRSLRTGACKNQLAEAAWNEYHDYIDTARARVTAEHGRGWFTDIHGHGHDIQRLELGYLLRASDLRQADATLDGSVSYENQSSVRVFSAGATMTFSRLLRGPASLGTLLEAEGVPSVPSSSTPHPLVGEDFLSGGYSVSRHACAAGTTDVCGVQIEHDGTVRATADDRAAYAADLVRVYETFLAQNFGFNLATGAYDVMIDNDNLNNDTTRARFVGASSWTNSSQHAQRHLNSVLLSDGASSTDEGAFLFHVGTAGTYQIYAWWPSSTTLTTGAIYRVVGTDGTTVLGEMTLNQRAGAGQWNLLGRYTFGTGWGKVAVARYPEVEDGAIAIDAIRVVKQ